MEQRRDASSESPPSDAVDEETSTADETDAEPVLERYFWPLLAASVLLAVAAGVGVAYTQYGRLSRAAASVQPPEQIAQVAGSIPYVRGMVDSLEAEEGATREYGTFTKLEGLIVNPADSEGRRYLALSLAFETTSSSVAEELTDKEVVVRDAVLDLLSERTVKELTAPARRDDLKKMLLEETNRILSNGTVHRLYFTEFVLQ